MSLSEYERAFEILLADDSPTDVLISLDALREAQILCHTHVVEDGTDVMSFLRGEGPYSDRPRPDLILLDLNMPKRDGLEVLVEIKNNESFRLIPVAILTVSDGIHDIVNSYRLEALSFITKPVTAAQLTELFQNIKSNITCNKS